LVHGERGCESRERDRARPLLFSESFTDALRLLAEAEKLGLEGIVSKDKNARYIPGPRCGWVKVEDAVLAQGGGSCSPKRR